MRRLLLIALVLLLTLPSCDQDPGLPRTYPAQGKVVRIVSSFPKRGLSASQSKLITQAIDLAVEQERKNITTTMKIEHVALDGGAGETGDWTPEQERANATLAANDPSVVAYIGPYTSGATGVSLPITNKAGLLQLSPMATWPGLTLAGWNEGEPGKYYPTGKRNFVRLLPPDSAQATAAAQWAARLGARSALVVSDGSTYSDGMAVQFKDSAPQFGLKIAGSSVLGADASKVAAEITASGADAAFYAPSTVGQAVKVAKALKGIHSQTGIFASDTALSDQFIEGVGGDAENWHVVSNDGGRSEPCREPARDDSSLWFASCFGEDFKQRYGEKPTPFAENAYVLARLALQAVARGGDTNRNRILEWVVDLKGFYRRAGDGPAFDTNGDVTRWEMSAYRLRDGRFVAEEPIRSVWNGQTTVPTTTP